MKKYLLLLSISMAASAEVHNLTLQQALSIASQQNPDITLARLAERYAQQGVKVAKNPFSPKVYGGSGLAYTSGFPTSIEGSSPSIFQAKTDMDLYNRPQSLKVAAARENARGAQISVQAKSEEIAYRTASLFLDALQAAKQADAIGRQLPSLERVSDTMVARVNEGQELPVEVKRANVNLASAKQRFEALTADQEYAESSLAVVLGYPPTDRVRAMEGVASRLAAPPSEQEAIETALASSKEIKRLQSSVLAKELEVQSMKASRLPQVKLVAQYSLLGKFNNYEDYFTRFQRNNYQFGASFLVPILVGSGASGMAEQAASEMHKLRIQMNQTRDRIILDTKRGYQELKKAENARNLARMQLDLAREDLNVLLAKMTEGQVPMSRVEQARVIENDRWLDLYTAETQVERAILSILKQTGNLMATLREGEAPRTTPIP